jgi:hypothetical protein
MNTGGVFPGNPNSVMIKNSKVSPGISIFECVAVDEHADLLALLIRTVTDEVFTTKSQSIYSILTVLVTPITWMN